MRPEREVHSFLFADLVGFTALTAARGDETAAELAVEFTDFVRDLADQYGLEFVKAMGDGVMVRGASAAQTVQLALRVAYDEPWPSWRPPVRIGVHTGPAVTRAGDWFGSTVNVAARLAASARGGEILISEDTGRRLQRRSGVNLVEQGARRLRDVPEPLQVLAARPASEVDCPKQAREPFAVEVAA